MVGLDSPYSSKEYGANWSKQRKKCLKRDNYSCRVCEKTQQEIGKEPSVHHITPRSQFQESEWREYNKLENLVSLCPSCHGKYEGKHTECNVQEFIEAVE